MADIATPSFAVKITTSITSVRREMELLCQLPLTYEAKIGVAETLAVMTYLEAILADGRALLNG